MKHRRTSLPCGFQEDALITVVLDEADAALRQAVHTHIRVCQACGGVYARYGNVQEVLTALQAPKDIEEPLQRAQEKLTHRLARRPVVHCSYAWCSTVLGKIRYHPQSGWFDEGPQRGPALI